MVMIKQINSAKRCYKASTVIILLIICCISIRIYANETELKKTSSKPYSMLWLNYKPSNQNLHKDYAAVVRRVYCPGNSPILLNARDELVTAASKLTGSNAALTESVDRDGIVLVGTLKELGNYLPDNLVDKASGLKDQGYVIKSLSIKGKKCTIITSKDSSGVLYGVFGFVRLMQTGKPIDSLSLSEEPDVNLRMLNHWDNLHNRYVTRGYAGLSLWNWDSLAYQEDQRHSDYARLCASIGINGVVLNNVNADSRILRQDYLEKVRALADIFRNWGIRTYLSASFIAPTRPSDNPKGFRRGGIGDLDTADPLNPEVRQWWKNKAKQIYTMIPDFGGFLVKADSEGMPGPRDYNRTHADGANMLADALKPYGGVLIWRAFVYQIGKDRAMDAFNEFKKFDGQFRDNVFIQVKNGPLDFQPREPFTPLFGAMPNTHLGMELQITKEYLGQRTTLAYLGTMWSEILNSDTYVKGKGSTVAKVIDGSLHKQNRTCIAGVANTGDNSDWCGHVFNQANWYAFGRLAWNLRLSPDTIAEEWIKMTFQSDPETNAVIRKMMMGSYDAYVDYTMPLGLNFLASMAHHYMPNPKGRTYYHRADSNGLGFDRTSQGSNYVSQYHPELQAIFNDPDKIPLKYLLWFHHIQWDKKISTGRTLWEELNFRYNGGVEYVDKMAEIWETLKGKIDPAIHKSVMSKLNAEKEFARKWRDECLEYFSGFTVAESSNKNKK